MTNDVDCYVGNGREGFVSVSIFLPAPVRLKCQRKDNMLYYKYMSYQRFTESILPGGAFIKVSRPCEFNDPFDCVGGLVGDFNSKTAEEYCNMFYADVRPNSYCASAKAHFLGRLGNRRFFNEWFRILSLSDASRLLPNGEALMWSHYADNARGVRLTLDFPVIQRM